MRVIVLAPSLRRFRHEMLDLIEDTENANVCRSGNTSWTINNTEYIYIDSKEKLRGFTADSIMIVEPMDDKMRKLYEEARMRLSHEKK